MKRFKSYEFDREKKIHKVEKGSGVKHKKSIYNYEVDEEVDLEYNDEKYLDEVDTKDTNQYT